MFQYIARRLLVAIPMLLGAMSIVFFAMRNISVRFWIPFAANNMRNLVQNGFKDVQRFSADWHANNFAGATVRRVSRAMCFRSTTSSVP